VTSRRCASAILSSVACQVLQYFLSHKRHDFRKNGFEQKMCALMFSTTLSETILFLGRFKRSTIKKYVGLQVNYPLCYYKGRYRKSDATVNVLLLRSFIHIAYLRNYYMFRPFFLGHHQIDRISYSRQLHNAILSL